jgi:hypothetical protein
MTTNTTFDMTDLDDELDEANKKHNGHGAPRRGHRSTGVSARQPYAKRPPLPGQ